MAVSNLSLLVASCLPTDLHLDCYRHCSIGAVPRQVFRLPACPRWSLCARVSTHMATLSLVSLSSPLVAFFPDNRLLSQTPLKRHSHFFIIIPCQRMCQPQVSMYAGDRCPSITGCVCLCVCICVWRSIQISSVHNPIGRMCLTAEVDPVIYCAYFFLTNFEL